MRVNMNSTTVVCRSRAAKWTHSSRSRCYSRLSASHHARALDDARRVRPTTSNTPDKAGRCHLCDILSNPMHPARTLARCCACAAQRRADATQGDRGEQHMAAILQHSISYSISAVQLSDCWISTLRHTTRRCVACPPST